MYAKELSDSDLGIGTSHQTHIGLHEDMVRGWSEKDRTYDAYLFVGDPAEPVSCQAVINGITTPDGKVRSPKIKTGAGIPEEKNLLRLIRKHGSADKRWLSIAQLPDDRLFVFLGKRPKTVDSIAEEAQPVDLEDAGRDLPDIVKRFAKDAGDCDLRFDLPAIQRFIAALLSKRFLLLTGLAGSGKTKLAQAFARWIVEENENCAVLPVGADWTGNENILGYPDGLDATNYVLKPALQLILRAKESETPHFLILDEMNLSHVERYFADILSAIESDEKVPLYRGVARAANGLAIPQDLELPDNLFVIGTVNVDETTYMFSPKVLDRANAIEFRTDEAELLKILKTSKKPDIGPLSGKGYEDFAKQFVETTRLTPSLPSPVKTSFDNEMMLFFAALKSLGAEFGYRMAVDAARLFYFYRALGAADDSGDSFNKAFDCVVAQKILPKLHGSRAKLAPLLKILWYLCVNDLKCPEKDDSKRKKFIADTLVAAEKSTSEPSVDGCSGAPFPVSADKIARMWRLLKDNGFASFAEA
jgi:5-methylcytosine-specific restriction protein B